MVVRHGALKVSGSRSTRAPASTCKLVGRPTFSNNGKWNCGSHGMNVNETNADTGARGPTRSLSGESRWQVAQGSCHIPHAVMCGLCHSGRPGILALHGNSSIGDSCTGIKVLAPALWATGWHLASHAVRTDSRLAYYMALRGY